MPAGLPLEEAESRLRECLTQLRHDEIRRNLTLFVFAADECEEDTPSLEELRQIVADELLGTFVEDVVRDLRQWRAEIAAGAAGNATQKPDSGAPVGATSDARR